MFKEVDLHLRYSIKKTTHGVHTVMKGWLNSTENLNGVYNSYEFAWFTNM
jgi:hypothetical protein